MGEFVVFKNRLGIWIAYGYFTDKNPEIYRYENTPYGFSTIETAAVKSYAFAKYRALEKAAKKLKKYTQKLQ